MGLIMPNLKQFFNMIRKNIFRPLPVIRRTTVPGELGTDDDDQEIDPSWKHFQPVYEVFYQLILNDLCEANQLKGHINANFMQ